MASLAPALLRSSLLASTSSTSFASHSLKRWASTRGRKPKVDPAAPLAEGECACYRVSSWLQSRRHCSSPVFTLPLRRSSPSRQHTDALSSHRIATKQFARHRRAHLPDTGRTSTGSFASVNCRRLIDPSSAWHRRRRTSHRLAKRSSRRRPLHSTRRYLFLVDYQLFRRPLRLDRRLVR